jgi:hypothetical protein
LREWVDDLAATLTILEAMTAVEEAAWRVQYFLLYHD